MSKGLLNLKVIDIDMINQDEIKSIVDLMQSYGYDVIVTPNNLDIDMVDEDAIIGSCDNYPVRASDIIELFNNRFCDAQKFTENNDDEEDDMPEFNRIQDGIIKIQAFMEELNNHIQMEFPDNDELHTLIKFNDDYIDAFIKSGVISYSIDSNNPFFLDFLQSLLDEFDTEDQSPTNILNAMYNRLCKNEE